MQVHSTCLERMPSDSMQHSERRPMNERATSAKFVTAAAIDGRGQRLLGSLDWSVSPSIRPASGTCRLRGEGRPMSQLATSGTVRDGRRELMGEDKGPIDNGHKASPSAPRSVMSHAKRGLI